MREDNVRKIWSDAELDTALSDLHADVGEDDDLAFARASVLAAAGASTAPPPETRRPWRWIVAAAAVVALVGGLAGVATLRSSPPEQVQPATALADLDRPLEPGEFRYTQKLEWIPQYMSGVRAKAQRKVELWIPADPTGVWHRRTVWTGAVSGLDPAKAQLNRTPSDEYGPGGSYPRQKMFSNWLTPDAAFVATLEPDRNELVQRLTADTVSPDRTKSHPHEPSESLAMARSVLELGLLPKDLRVALADAVGTLPGVFSRPDRTPDGRPATVVVAKDTGQRLYFDPSTAQLLAVESSPFAPPTSGENAPPGTSPSSQPVPPRTTSRPSTPDEEFTGPDAVYSYAITRTSG